MRPSLIIHFFLGGGLSLVVKSFFAGNTVYIVYNVNIFVFLRGVVYRFNFSLEEFPNCFLEGFPNC